MADQNKAKWPVFCISIRVPPTEKVFEWTCEINPEQSAYSQDIVLSVLEVAMDKLAEVLKAEKAGAE